MPLTRSERRAHNRIRESQAEDYDQSNKENIPPLPLRSNLIMPKKKSKNSKRIKGSIENKIQTTIKRVNPFRALPTDILESIFLFLDAKDILALAATCLDGMEVARVVLSMVYSSSSKFIKDMPQLLSMLHGIHQNLLSQLDKTFKRYIAEDGESLPRLSLIDHSALLRWVICDPSGFSMHTFTESMLKFMRKSRLGERFWRTVAFEAIQERLVESQNRTTRFKEFFLDRLASKIPALVQLRNAWFFHHALERVFVDLFHRHCSHCRKYIHIDQPHILVCTHCSVIERNTLEALNDAGVHFFVPVCIECDQRNEATRYVCSEHEETDNSEGTPANFFTLAHIIRWNCPHNNYECEIYKHFSQKCTCSCHH